MKTFFPFKKKTTTLALVTALLVVCAGLTATGASANVFSSISTGLGSAINAWWTTPAAGPTVTTDKPDYAPGETVIITGSGFGPNDMVTLQVTDVGPRVESADATGYGSWTKEADANGSFTTSWLVPLEAANRKLLLTAVGSPSGLSASTTFTDASIGLYDQCSNDDGDGYAAGDTGCRWIFGNLNKNNSRYSEGDSTAQRLWLTDLEPGSTHTVTLEYGTTKSATHAYDFLTTYNDSEDWITLADICQDITGCTTASVDQLAIPQDPLVPDTFENAVGDRFFTMHGGDLTLASTPTLFSGVYGSGDSETRITVTFTVAEDGSMCDASGCDVALFFGAHISKTTDWTGPLGDGFGGATNINGSPYHVQLAAMDGASIGNRDNQMQADAIVQTGSITIIKDTQPNNDQDFAFTTTGTGLSGFTLDDNGNNADGTSNTKQFLDVAAGTYTVTESAVAGWSNTSITCQSVDGTNNNTINVPNRSVSISLEAGEDVTCTFVNAPQNGKIQIVKNTDGGIPGKTYNWGFTPVGFNSGSVINLSTTGANDTDSSTEFTVSVIGTYSVSETSLPAGWDLTSSSCTQGTPANIVVTANTTTVCTFTNTEDLEETRGRIVIDKVTDPSGSGQLFTFNPTGFNSNNTFQLADATTPFDSGFLVPTADGGGPYSISETVPAGWSLTSSTCSDGSSIGAINLAAGEIVTCTFTNTLDSASITVVKNTVPDGPTDFAFTTGGTGPAGFTAGFTLDDDGGGGSATPNSLTFNFTGADATGTKTITEPAVAGFELTDLVCTGGGGDTSAAANVATVGLDPGENVTCTFTNTQQGKIIVVKQTNPDGSTVDFEFDPSYDDNFFLSDGESNDSGFLSPGKYSVAEVNIPMGWSLVSSTCDQGETVGDIDVEPGQTVTCTFTNSQPDLSIKVESSDTNEVGDDHEFTITVTQIPNGATAATTANILPSVNPAPDSQSTTCGPAVSFNGGNVATCTFTINNNDAGVFDVDASASATIGGISVSASTIGDSGPGGNSGATKTFVDARITIGESAVNEVGDPHPFTVTVFENPGTGEVAAAGETVTLTITSGTATFVGNGLQSITCVTNASGQCTQSITSNTPGVVTVNASVGVSVGGLTVNRSTNSTHGSSGPATKRYVDGRILISPLVDTNPVNEAHTFTATVQQDDGLTAAQGGDGVTGFAPVPNGTLVEFAFEQNTIGATFVGNDDDCTTTNGQCTVQINSVNPGVVIVSASSTFTVGGISITRETGTGGPNSANAQKTYEAGVIIVDKVTLPGSSTQSFEFDTNYGANFFLTNAATPNNSGPLAPGTYSVAEVNIPAGWDLTSTVCTSSLGGTKPANEIVLTAGETVNCVFTNTQRGRIIVDKVTVPAGDPQSFSFDAGGTGYNDFSLTDAAAPNNQEVVPGAYSVSETVPDGWDLTSATCTSDETPASLDVDPGETVTCTFTNTKRGKIIVKKETDPDGSTVDFEFDTNYGSNFFLSDGEQNDSGFLVPDKYSVAEVNIPAGWDLTGSTCDMGETVGDIDVGAGETVTCTFTNTKRGTVIFSKTENGGVTTREFNFEIRVGASLNDEGDPIATAKVPIGSDELDDITFNCIDEVSSALCEDIPEDDPNVDPPVVGVAHFPPGTYYFCETGLLPNWTHTLEMIDGMDDNDVFVPNGNDESADSSIQCVEITITAGGELNLGTIDNRQPGDAHTIGFWKNWTSCDGRGNQKPVLDFVLSSFGNTDGSNDPVDAADTPEDPNDIFGYPGPYVPGVNLGARLKIDTCEKAVLVLSKQSLGGKVKGPARRDLGVFLNVSAQLLAAKLNIQAGAEDFCIGPVITLAEQYLTFYGYSGLTTSMSITNADKQRLNTLAGYLDDYNNNDLVCPVTLPPAPGTP